MPLPLTTAKATKNMYGSKKKVAGKKPAAKKPAAKKPAAKKGAAKKMPAFMKKKSSKK